MATQQPAPMAADAAPTDDADQGASSGYTIELHVDGTGAISVSVEPDGADEADASAAPPDGSGAPMEGEEDQDEAQPVPNIREAVKLILDIYKNAGQMQDNSGDMDQMAQGYGVKQ